MQTTKWLKLETIEKSKNINVKNTLNKHERLKPKTIRKRRKPNLVFKNMALKTYQKVET